jgi:hypothetical protein
MLMPRHHTKSLQALPSHLTFAAYSVTRPSSCDVRHVDTVGWSCSQVSAVAQLSMSLWTGCKEEHTHHAGDADIDTDVVGRVGAGG